MLLLLMALQSGLGLALPGRYLDVEWIRATWFGNDAVTLLIAAPLLGCALMLRARGSHRGYLLWLGLLGYSVYNYAFYLLGAALNVFFPIYVGAFLMSASALLLALVALDEEAVAASFRVSTPVRAIGDYLLFVAVGLTAVWMGAWAAFAFLGRPTPVETSAFQLAAALDLTLMVPALAAGGWLLWGRRAWRYVISSVAAVQGALYLLVLTVNSAVALRRRLAEPPGELPIWAPLCLATAIAAGYC